MMIYNEVGQKVML